MRGKVWVCNFVLLVSLFLSSVAFGQVCEYPDPSEADPDRYIVIDGKTYEYVDIETSKKRLKAVQENESLREEVSALEKKVSLKDAKIGVLEERIAIMRDASQMDKQLIDKLFENGFHEPRQTPLVKRPAFNYLLGIGTAGGLFFLWRFAEETNFTRGE